MYGEKGCGCCAAFRQFFDDEACIESRHGQSASMFRGIHTHKAKLTCLAQGILGKNTVGIPLRGIGCELVFREGLGGGDEALLFFGEGKVHCLSQGINRVGAVYYTAPGAALGWRCEKLGRFGEPKAQGANQ